MVGVVLTGLSPTKLLNVVDKHDSEIVDGP